MHYWHGDHLGSSTVVTDSTGAKVQAITYFPYGDIRTNQSFTTPAVNVPYKYTGKELDASSNLYFYESRYYHPVFGRFVSPDTIVPDVRDPQSLNRYSYARNNPMLYTDSTGHIFGIDDVIVIIIVGAVIGTVTSGIQSDWDIGATLTGGIIGGVTAGVGFGVGSSVAAATLSSLGSVGSGIAGGVVGGAVAGGTSGVLANLAGYKVNIGLAIASGAAAGGIVGGAGAQWGQLGAFAAAPAAGASAAAISGADPGMGATIAAATAAFALGVQQAYEVYQRSTLAGKPNEDLVVAKNNSGGRPDFREINPQSNGIPRNYKEAFGDAIKEMYDMQQDMAGRLGNNAESSVNFRRDIDQIPLQPGTQKGQYYYTDPRGNVVGGPYDGPALYEGSREHFRILRSPGPPQLQQGR